MGGGRGVSCFGKRNVFRLDIYHVPPISCSFGDTSVFVAYNQQNQLSFTVGHCPLSKKLAQQINTFLAFASIDAFIIHTFIMIEDCLQNKSVVKIIICGVLTIQQSLRSLSFG